MCLVLMALTILLAGSEISRPSSPSDQIILHIIKTGGIGGVHQEVLVFRNGRMSFSGGSTVRLDAKELARLVALAKRLPAKPKRRRIKYTQGHDYPLMYWVRINDAGKETIYRFRVETKDAAVNEFVTAIKSHERRSMPQLKTP